MINTYIYFITFVTIITALIFLIGVKKRDTIIMVFGSYLVMCGCFEIISQLTYKGDYNIPAFHLYNLLEFIFLSIFFLLVFEKLKDWFFLIILLSVIFIYYIVFVQTIFTYITFLKNISDAIFIFASIASLFKFLDSEFKKENVQIIKYFIYGILINFCGAFCIYLFVQFTLNYPKNIIYSIWFVNITLKLIAQGFYIYALLKLIQKDRVVYE